MRNIFKLLKYNFGIYDSGISKMGYVIALVFLVFFSLGGRINIPYVPEIMSGLSIAFVASFLGINFIVAIIKFSLQVSKDEGNLVFMFPVKSWEFMVAKFLEFTIMQAVIVLVVLITSLLSLSSISGMIVLTSVATAFGTVVAYIAITSYIVIFASYINNTFLCVLAVIFGGGIIESIVEFINWGITRILPYVYLRIGTFIEIDIIDTLLNGVWIILLVVIGIKHLNKKLDIM